MEVETSLAGGAALSSSGFVAPLNANSEECCVVKVSQGEEIRRIPFDGKHFEQLKEKCKELFKIKNMNIVAFTYEDQEKDNVMISTDGELAAFLAYAAASGKCGLLKLNRRTKNKSADETVVSGAHTNTISSNTNVVSNKYVRLTINNEQRKCGKTGNYLGVVNGKLVCHAGRGRSGIWSLNRTQDGEFTLSALDQPHRYLRMMRSGKVNLNKGRPGKWARWSLARERADNPASLDDIKEIQLYSLAIPGQVLSITERNNRLVACGLPVGDASAIKSSFRVEAVDPLFILRSSTNNITLGRKETPRQKQSHRRLNKEEPTTSTGSPSFLAKTGSPSLFGTGMPSLPPFAGSRFFEKMEEPNDNMSS